jgi:hypothetical protein
MTQKDLYEESANGVLIIRSRKSGDIAGMLIETKYADGVTPCFTTYLPTPGGFEWMSQSDDREKELAALRSLLYADCECCGEWPCECTPEELEEYRVEHAATVAEMEAWQ